LRVNDAGVIAGHATLSPSRLAVWDAGVKKVWIRDAARIGTRVCAQARCACMGRVHAESPIAGQTDSV
jgi:hypothetical protein